MCGVTKGLVGAVHCGGADLLSSRFAIRQILTGPGRSRSPAYRQLLARLEITPGKWRRVARGDQACGWDVLHPGPQDGSGRAGDSAVVLRGQFHGTRVLLLSDLGRLGQRQLLERETDLRADILVAGLSGSDFLSQALLDAVKPRLLIVAGAPFPAANRPNRQLRQRLARLRLPLVYTSDAGAAVLRFAADGWHLKTMDGRQATADALGPYLPDPPPLDNDVSADEIPGEPDGPEPVEPSP